MPDNDSDYQVARSRMVSEQLQGRGILDQRVLHAMSSIPRHLFIPEKRRAHAYADAPQSIGAKQTISQPYMVAMMTELLELKPTDNVLEIGTGSGYQAAILSSLANSITTVERVEGLADSARILLNQLGLTNVRVVKGDGTLGFKGHAPYDAIIITAGSPQVPPSLKGQLAMGGRLVCPVGDREKQTILKLRRTQKGLVQEEGIPCIFVPLIGAEGWRLK